MAGQVLTEEEKSALLDGVASGAVRVQSGNGEEYASVRPFDIAARCRIVTNSYPRLQSVNQRFAERAAKQAEVLLQCELDVRPVESGLRSFREWSDGLGGPCVAAAFEAEPLSGKGLVVLAPELVAQLVEAFFGGAGVGGARPSANAFSAGELSVSNLFADLVLATIQETWRSLVAFSPVRVATETGLDHFEPGEDGDEVIVTAFELTMTDADTGGHGQFHIAWPLGMVTPLLPAFDGRRRERDAAADARWEKAIRRTLAEAPMQVSIQVGGTRLPLGDVVRVVAGDILPISSPGTATVLAGNVPILNGRFGVLDGRNAVEAGEWLTGSGHTSSVTGR